MRVSVESILFALAMALLVTLFFYIQKGMPPLQNDVQKALETLFIFWLGIVWAIAFLLALFRSIKWLFHRCYNGYMLRLVECGGQEFLEDVGYGDLMRVWRRWFLALIWIVTIMSVVTAVFMHLFFHVATFFSWMSPVVLYIFTLIAGYFVLWLLGSYCKRVKVVKC